MLQRDDAAHVVADAASGLTAYAVFEPGAKLPAAGRLVAADRPTLFLYREAGDGLEVTLCDPELHYARNRYPVAYAPVTTSLLVRDARTAPALPAGVAFVRGRRTHFGLVSHPARHVLVFRHG